MEYAQINQLRKGQIVFPSSVSHSDTREWHPPSEFCQGICNRLNQGTGHLQAYHHTFLGNAKGLWIGDGDWYSQEKNLSRFIDFTLSQQDVLCIFYYYYFDQTFKLVAVRKEAKQVFLASFKLIALVLQPLIPVASILFPVATRYSKSVWHQTADRPELQALATPSSYAH